MPNRLEIYLIKPYFTDDLDSLETLKKICNSYMVDFNNAKKFLYYRNTSSLEKIKLDLDEYHKKNSHLKFVVSASTFFTDIFLLIDRNKSILSKKYIRTFKEHGVDTDYYLS